MTYVALVTERTAVGPMFTYIDWVRALTRALGALLYYEE